MNFRPSLAWSPPPSSPSRLHTEEAGDGDSVVTQWVMNLPDFRAQREFEMAKLFRLSARNPNLVSRSPQTVRYRRLAREGNSLSLGGRKKTLSISS